tara:strand:+ start:224 stop:547 length:324 start_codon:yes stop_codon:yes gene_type:complete
MKNASNEVVCNLDDDTKTLEQYGARNGYCLHCVDTNPNAKSFLGEFDDVSKVEKFEISEAAYDKRDDSYRKFRERMLKANPNFLEYAGQVKFDKDHLKEESEAITVG